MSIYFIIFILSWRNSMRFNKQIFTILILSLSLSLGGSGCISEGYGAEDIVAQEITVNEFHNYLP